MPLFDSDFLKKLEYLSLISKRVFRGSLLAQRRTMQKGAGIEFADHREYTPGDDFRYLDWNLFARLDELLLKRFQEEEDLHVYFLLDASRSMAFGDPPKFDFARQVAAALAYIALADLDRIAVVAFANDIVADFPLTRGKGRILGPTQVPGRADPSGEDTSLERVATGFVHREQRRGLGRRSQRSLRYGRLRTRSRPAAAPAATSRISCRSTTTTRKSRTTCSATSNCGTSSPARAQGDRDAKRICGSIASSSRTFRTSVQRYCNRYGLGCTRTSTEIPFDQLILRMMRQAAVR